MLTQRVHEVSMQAALKILLTTAIPALLCAGCSSPEPRNEPDEMLAPRVAAWERSKTGESSARDLVKDTEIHDPDLIRHQIQELAVVYPGHVPTLMANAIVSYDSKDPARAQQYLDRVFAICPAHPEGAILRSRIAIEEGNLGFARKLLEEQVHLTPDAAGLREALSGVYYLSSRLDDARASLDAAARLGSPPWRVSFNRGLIEEAAGHSVEAKHFYQETLTLNANCAAAGSRLRGLGQNGPAEVPATREGVNALGDPVKH
jgi:tetratricopeptide (TPR) repeat protein